MDARARSRARRVAGRRRPSRRRRRGIHDGVGERLERRGAARGGQQGRQRQAPERRAGFGAAVGARIARARRASPRASRRRGHGGRAPAPARAHRVRRRGLPRRPRRLRRHPRPLAPLPGRARAGRGGAQRRTRRAQVPGHRRRGRSRARHRFRRLLRRRRVRIFAPGYTAVIVARSTNEPPGAEARAPVEQRPAQHGHRDARRGRRTPRGRGVAGDRPAMRRHPSSFMHA